MKNYAIKNLNGWQNVEGKTFLGKELGMTGAEASLQRIAAGEDAPSFIRTRPTKSFMLSSRAKASMKWTARRSP